MIDLFGLVLYFETKSILNLTLNTKKTLSNQENTPCILAYFHKMSIFFLLNFNRLNLICQKPVRTPLYPKKIIYLEQNPTLIIIPTMIVGGSFQICPTSGRVQSPPVRRLTQLIIMAQNPNWRLLIDAISIKKQGVHSIKSSFPQIKIEQ